MLNFDMVIKINYLRKQDDELKKKSEIESEKIGKTWDWTSEIKKLFNKTLGKNKEKKEKINKNDLIEVIQYDRLLYDGQILPLKSQVAASYSFESKTINDSYRKETDKNKESFGSVESITIKAFLKENPINQIKNSSGKKKNSDYDIELSVDVKFSQEYNSSISSQDTTSLTNYLEEQRKNGNLDFRRDANTGKIIIRIKASKIYEKAHEEFINEKDGENYKKFITGELTKASDLLSSFSDDIKNQIVSIASEMKDDQEAAKNAQDYLKLKLLHDAVESNSLDEYLEYAFAKQIGNEMNKNFQKILNQVSEASGAGFKDAVTDKVDKMHNDTLNVANNPFYKMASRHLTPDNFKKFKDDFLQGIKKQINENKLAETKKNEISGKIDIQKIKDDLKIQLDPTKNEKFTKKKLEDVRNKILKNQSYNIGR